MTKQYIKSKATGRMIEVSGLTTNQSGEVRRSRLLRAATGAALVAGVIVAGAVLSVFSRGPRT